AALGCGTRGAPSSWAWRPRQGTSPSSRPRASRFASTRKAVSLLSPELPRLRDARLEGGAERLAHRLQLDAVEHVLEEAAHDQPLRFGARETARHQVEELLAVDLAERRAVRAAHVVGEDLEAGDRVGVRALREQQVAVLLV